jgi:hypothetical protein
VLRSSIFRAMAVVALVAVNLAVLPALGPFPLDALYPDASPIFLVGLLPLINAQFVGLYCLTASRQRILRRRRASPMRIRLAATFVAVNALALGIAIAASAIAPRRMMFYLGFVGDLIYETKSWRFIEELPFGQLVGTSLVLGAVMSGPPLIMTLTTSWLACRYEFVIVRRPGETPPEIGASASPAAIRSAEVTPWTADAPSAASRTEQPDGSRPKPGPPELPKDLPH